MAKKIQAKEIVVYWYGEYDEFHGLLVTHFNHQTNIEIGKQLTSKDVFNTEDAQNYPVIVVDTMSKKFGFENDLELLELIIQVMPDKRVIAFNDRFDNDLMKQVNAMGAHGYFFRAATNLNDISNCINLVAKGETAFNYE